MTANNTPFRKKQLILLASVSALLLIMVIIAMSRGLGFANISFGQLFGKTAPQGQLTVSKGTVIASMKDGYQEVRIVVGARSYAPVVVQIDVPVRMIFEVPLGKLNGCNNAITIPSYGIEKGLKVGDTVVEFTPTSLGTVKYSCWMNMIRDTITVVLDLKSIKQ
ncbi:MAG: hypothetical protein Q8N36_00720 [bacterium]|nr:hypothetical protein [bacterium]